MNFSLATAKMIATFGDARLRELVKEGERLAARHSVEFSWADDGLGYILVLSPKIETEEEIEARFFTIPSRRLVFEPNVL